METGANIRENSRQKPPSDHWHGGGLNEEIMTPFICEVIGRGHGVSPAGLPIEQVVNEYSLS